MKKTEAQSKINAVNAVRIEIEPGVAEELALAATVGLLDHGSGPGSLARSLYKGPWPQDVLKLVTELRDRVEEHLLTVYFEVTENDRTTTGRSKRSDGPIGIIEPQLGGSSTSTPQL